jgi:uncharacterized protein (TIRG00374 family)
LKRNLAVVVQLLAGFLLLVILLGCSDANQTYRVVFAADPLLVLLASAFIFSASALIALSFYAILLSLGFKMNFLKCLGANFGGQLASDLTPGRIGYFVTPFILETVTGVPFEPCLAATVVSGVIDFFLRALLAAGSTIYLMSATESISAAQWIVVLSTLLLASGSFLLMLSVWSKKSKVLILRLKRFKRLEGIIEQYMDKFETFQKEGARAKGSIGITAAFMCSASVLEAMALYLLSLSVRVNLSPVLFIFIHSLASSFTYVPLTIAGLGVQESALALSMHLFGVPLSHGLSVALLFRFFYTITDIIGIPSLAKFGYLKVIGKAEAGKR